MLGNKVLQQLKQQTQLYEHKTKLEIIETKRAETNSQMNQNKELNKFPESFFFH